MGSDAGNTTRCWGAAEWMDRRESEVAELRVVAIGRRRTEMPGFGR
jgi:hypothetical protein